MKRLKKLFSALLSLFYPKLCVGCGDVLRENEPHLCLHCLLHLPETDYHLFPGNPLEVLFWGRIRVERVAAFLFFRKGAMVQKMLHALKYKGNWEIGEYLGQYYGRKLRASGCFEDVAAILPIPLHKKKLRIRGYNQSEAIAKGLSQAMGIPYYVDVLIRTEFTETQTKKGRFSRWENVKNVFAVQKVEKIAGKHVLVCDDVLTTGATTEAAVTPLLKCNSVRVSIVTLACAE